jgi:hypothetical protein
MASASVPGIPAWGNLYYPAPRGASRPAPRHGGGRRVLWLGGPGMTGRVGCLPPYVCRSAVFVRSVQPHGPPPSRFLIRPPPHTPLRPRLWGGRAFVSLHTLPVEAMLTSMVPRSGTELPCAKEKR